jgi:dienelactone hydrolase
MARQSVASSRAARELTRAKLTKEQAARLKLRKKRRILRNRLLVASVLLIVAAGVGFYGLKPSHASSEKERSKSVTPVKKTHNSSLPKVKKTSPHHANKPPEEKAKDTDQNSSVSIATCTFIDYSRSTYNFYTNTTLPYRVLKTYIFYPKSTVSLQGNPSSIGAAAPPYPAIVFAEGYKVTPLTYRELLDSWTTKGFVVIAPMFPDTNAAAVKAMHNLPITEKDTSNEPADMAFVTRNVIADAGTPGSDCGVLYHLVNPNDLMLAGQSDGAQVVAALAYNTDYMSLLPSGTFKAVEVLSGDEIGVGGYTAPTDAPPLLFSQSNTDQCNPPQEAQALYDAIPVANKWFLELFNADHLPPYDGNDKAAFGVVSSVTSQFFILAAHGLMPGNQFVIASDVMPSVAHMTYGLYAPSLPTLTMTSKACYIK